MNRCFYALKVLFLGLFISQIIATLQVYLSNVDLHRKLVVIKEAGYLAIPNERVMPTLLDFGPAFLGGLFFTLSIGAGLSVFALAAGWSWDRLLHRNKYLLITFIILWIGTLISANYHGFCPLVALYFLFIPPMVFTATLRWMPKQEEKRVGLNTMVHILPVFLLALLWTTQMNSDMFLDFRDKFLLSNPLGTRISDFYYKYTLYAAEAFKSLDQKTLKTCNLQGIQKKPILRALERELLKHDYLVLDDFDKVDLKIGEKEGTGLVFENSGRPVLSATLKDFIPNPGQLLTAFSTKVDPFAFFRSFTFLCLLIGLPITLYLILYTLFCLGSSLIFDVKTSAIVASVFCLFIGISCFVFFSAERGVKIERKDLAASMKSDNWQRRVAALKIIHQKGLEVGDFYAYERRLPRPNIPERYWLVKALGAGKRSESYDYLLTFLDDPQPNVVSMTFSALGQRGDRRAVEKILKRIEISNDWFNQWYAYQALKVLGWKQTKSN